MPELDALPQELWHRILRQLPAHDDFGRSQLPLRLVNRKIEPIATTQAFSVRSPPP